MRKYIYLAAIVVMFGFWLRPELTHENKLENNIAGGVNAVPVITITNTEILSSINAVRVTYNLSDAENNPCKISLRISNDSGKTFLYSADSLSGDVGYPVTSGNNKQAYWYYTTLPGGFKAKLIADDLQTVDIQQIVNQVDSNNLKNNLQFITGVRHRTTGTVQLQRVKDSI